MLWPTRFHQPPALKYLVVTFKDIDIKFSLEFNARYVKNMLVIKGFRKQWRILFDRETTELDPNIEATLDSMFRSPLLTERYPEEGDETSSPPAWIAELNRLRELHGNES